MILGDEEWVVIAHFHWRTASCWMHNVCFIVLVISLGLRIVAVHKVSLHNCSVSQDVNYGKHNKEANQLNFEWIFWWPFLILHRKTKSFFLPQPNKEMPLQYSQGCWNIIVLLMRGCLNLIVFWRRPLGLPQMNSLSLVGCWLKRMQSISWCHSAVFSVLARKAE